MRRSSSSAGAARPAPPSPVSTAPATTPTASLRRMDPICAICAICEICGLERQTTEILVADLRAVERRAGRLVLLVEVMPDPGLAGAPEDPPEVDGSLADVGEELVRRGVHVLDVDQIGRAHV